jgi:hypothetical protein
MAGNLDENLNIGCKPINPKQCKTCVFSHGEPPFADAPEKRYCMVFSRESGNRKPNDVYYDGAECVAYEEE